MHFFFVIEGLAVAAGGPPRVVSAIANRLVLRGHRVTVGTFPVHGEQVALDEKIAIEILAPSRKLPSVVQASTKIRELGMTSDIVLVSGIWGAMDGLAVRLARVEPYKLYIRSCGMLEPYILAKSRWKKRIAKLVYVNSNLNRAAAVLANSSIEQRYISAMYPRSVVKIVPNGVILPDKSILSKSLALRELQLHLPDAARVLLYLGRIDRKKGLDLFLPQFKEFLKEHREWHLVVAGSCHDKEYGQTIDAMAKGLESNVHFLGEVSGIRKDSCFRIADGFILPSHSEGFPNAVVEALSWGVPALITAGCNFPEVEEAHAGIITSLNPSDMLCKIKEFCLGIDLASAGERARELVMRRFTLDRIVDLYEQLRDR